MKRGFTLIEALTVIAIIGVLSTLTAFVITQAQRQARDATRKSDLTAIAVAFQSRYEVQTCSLAARRHYPGYLDQENSDSWQPVSALANTSDDCGAFSEFLTTIPRDPRLGPNYNFPYRFNLASQPALGKHFRLKARLELEPNADQKAENCRLSQIWVTTFGGQPYDGCVPIGQAPAPTVVAGTRSALEQNELCLPDQGFWLGRAWADDHCNNNSPGPEICGNGLDDDGDGLVDGNDPDCQSGGGQDPCINQGHSGQGTPPEPNTEPNQNQSSSWLFWSRAYASHLCSSGGGQDPPPGGEDPIKIYNYFIGD